MSRFGRKKPTVHDKAHDEQVKHAHVPGMAYDIENPADRLMNIVGGGFFNEPKYYDSERPLVDVLKELNETGKISSVIMDASGMSEAARSVLETAQEVAAGEYEGADPDDLCVIASWARDTEDGLKIRTTPQILLAVAANNPRTRPTVDKYGTAIMQRPDDVCQTFAAFRDLFNPKVEGIHKGMLPHKLRKALEKSLERFSDYQLLKYNNDVRPNLADVLVMINGKPGHPVSKPMFEFLVNGKTLEGAPDVLVARKKFFELEDFADCDPELIERAQLTWENVLSKFGSKDNPKPEVWESIIPQMPEMALVRNLRNFEKAGISEKAWRVVTDKLLAVEKTKQLPYRFFTADREVDSEEAKEICELMLDKACQNVPDLEGTTAIFADNSGSTVTCPISPKSKISVCDAGNMLASIVAKRFGKQAVVGIFGDNFVWAETNEQDSCMDIKKKLDDIGRNDPTDKHPTLGIPALLSKYKGLGSRGIGGATETGLWFGIDGLTKRKVHVDRMILCSDLCCYTQGANNCGHDMSRYFGANATIQGMIDKYRREVNPNLKVYSVNISAHAGAQAQTRADEQSHRLSGWSENLFKTIADLESPVEREENEGPRAIPSLETLRQRYKKD